MESQDVWEKAVKRGRAGVRKEEFDVLNGLCKEMGDLVSDWHEYGMREGTVSYVYHVASNGEGVIEDSVNLDAEEKGKGRSVEEDRKRIKKGIVDFYSQSMAKLIEERRRLRRRVHEEGFTKARRKRMLRGGVEYANEINREIRVFRTLYDRRLWIMNSNVKQGLKNCRMQGLRAELKREQDREVGGFHNFTDYEPSVEMREVLNLSGGHVTTEARCTSSLSKRVRKVKTETEKCLLNMLKRTVARREAKEGRKKTKKACLKRRKEGEYVTVGSVRRQLLIYARHPEITNSERSFIYNGLSSLNRITNIIIRDVKRIEKGGVEKKMARKREGSIRKLVQNVDYIVREADKGMGFCINTKGWYEHEYRRQLQSGFYEYVCIWSEEEL